MFLVRCAIVLCAAFLPVLSLTAQYRGLEQNRNSNSQASMQYMQNLVGNLLQQVKSLQDENARLAEEVQSLSRQMQIVQKGAGRRAGELEKLRSSCAAEAEANRQHIKKLEKLVKDLAGAMAKTAYHPDRPGKEKTKRNIRRTQFDSTNGEFVEHTVEKGHVLYHIAKAYNVTVREIKNANNLKSDSLYVGQKLLIPVKKK
jgi:DNA repair exonuclease SbcCD ATPase subunit